MIMSMAYLRLTADNSSKVFLNTIIIFYHLHSLLNAIKDYEILRVVKLDL